jgi:hypothetical protein
MVNAATAAPSPDSSDLRAWLSPFITRLLRLATIPEGVIGDEQV